MSEGTIVGNYVDSGDLNKSAGLSNKTMSKKFQSIFRINSQYDENAVGVFVRKEVTSKQLRSRLVSVPGLNPSLKTSRLKYRIAKLK